MTSTSPLLVDILITFVEDAKSVYGSEGIGRGTVDSVGFDLRACLESPEEVVIGPGQRAMIPTGICVEPGRPGVAGFVYSRSGLGGVHGITVAQGVGVIDPDYRGEIRVPLLNTGMKPYTVRRGDRIAQLIFQPFFQPVFKEVATLGETARGTGGFGHTGR